MDWKLSRQEEISDLLHHHLLEPVARVLVGELEALFLGLNPRSSSSRFETPHVGSVSSILNRIKPEQSGLQQAAWA